MSVYISQPNNRAETEALCGRSSRSTSLVSRLYGCLSSLFDSCFHGIWSLLKSCCRCIWSLLKSCFSVICCCCIQCYCPESPSPTLPVYNQPPPSNSLPSEPQAPRSPPPRSPRPQAFQSPPPPLAPGATTTPKYQQAPPRPVQMLPGPEHNQPPVAPVPPPPTSPSLFMSFAPPLVSSPAQLHTAPSTYQSPYHHMALRPISPPLPGRPRGPPTNDKIAVSHLNPDMIQVDSKLPTGYVWVSSNDTFLNVVTMRFQPDSPQAQAVYTVVSDSLPSRSDMEQYYGIIVSHLGSILGGLDFLDATVSLSDIFGRLPESELELRELANEPDEGVCCVVQLVARLTSIANKQASRTRSSVRNCTNTTWRSLYEVDSPDVERWAEQQVALIPDERIRESAKFVLASIYRLLVIQFASIDSKQAASQIESPTAYEPVIEVEVDDHRHDNAADDDGEYDDSGARLQREAGHWRDGDSSNRRQLELIVCLKTIGRSHMEFPNPQEFYPPGIAPPYQILGSRVQSSAQCRGSRVIFPGIVEGSNKRMIFPMLVVV